MATSIGNVVRKISELLREVGSGFGGVITPMRSPDGTFGTQRAQAKVRAARRRGEAV